MAFNFKDTKSATSTEFFKPGIYRFKIADVKYGAFPKGTPYLEILFKTKEGKELSEKFAITENSINRIQYLHEHWLGKPCTVNFQTEKEVFTYMKKKLLEKNIVKSVIVGGDDLNGKVFAHLPYAEFIDNEGKLELGEFEKGSEEWKQFVTKKDAPVDSRTAGRKNGLLNEDDDDQTTDDDDEDQTGDDDDWGNDEDQEEPEEEVEEKPKTKAAAKKTATKAEPKKAAKKGAKKPEPEPEETDEDTDGEEAGDDGDDW